MAQARRASTTVAKNRRTQMSRITRCHRQGVWLLSEVTMTRTVFCQGGQTRAPTMATMRTQSLPSRHSSGLSRDMRRRELSWLARDKMAAGPGVWQLSVQQPGQHTMSSGRGRVLATLSRMPSSPPPPPAGAVLPGLGNMPVLGEKSKRKHMAYFQQPRCFSLSDENNKNTHTQRLGSEGGLGSPEPAQGLTRHGLQ